MEVRTQDSDVWVQTSHATGYKTCKTQPCNSLAGQTLVWRESGPRDRDTLQDQLTNYLHTDSCNRLDYHPNEQDHSNQDQRSLAPYGDITANNIAETREFSLLIRGIQYATIGGVGSDNLVLFDHEKGERHRS